MRAFFLLAGLCLLLTGCRREANGGGDAKDKNPLPIYEMVLRDQLGDGKGSDCFLFIQGKDPPAEVLKHIKIIWPDLEPGSKVPKQGGRRIDLDKLEWFDRSSVELNAGSSNGKDGLQERYRVTNKDGKWIVESKKITATS